MTAILSRPQCIKQHAITMTNAECYWIISKEQSALEFESKHKYFSPTKFFWNYFMQNWRHFVQKTNVINIH